MSSLARVEVVPRPDTDIVCTDSGAGSIVVLLHAGGENRRVWAPVAARLAEASIRSIAVDQRGHGDTGGCVDRFCEFVADACAVLDRIDGPVVLVGCSLGGLASLLAQRQAQPDRVAAVVLIDVVPDPDPQGARTYLQRVQARSERSPRGATRPWSWALVEDILSQGPSLRAAAAESRVPIALVRGERGLVRDADIARLRELVPSLVVRSVLGAGHLVARDQPRRLADALLELFDAPPLQSWRQH